MPPRSRPAGPATSEPTPQIRHRTPQIATSVPQRRRLSAVMGAAPAVIGRVDELAAVHAVVDAAAAGAASTLLISGEAGVGKTSLVRTVISDGVETVWASCLPLTSLAVPLLPLR